MNPRLISYVLALTGLSDAPTHAPPRGALSGRSSRLTLLAALRNSWSTASLLSLIPLRLKIARLSPSFRSRSLVPQGTTHFGRLMKFDRRTFLTASLGLAAGASTTALLNRPKYYVTRMRPRSRVSILRAESYSHDL